MNIDLTKEDLAILEKRLTGLVNGDPNDDENALLSKLSRYMPHPGHSPETEPKEGVVDTSKNKNWKTLEIKKNWNAP